MIQLYNINTLYAEKQPMNFITKLSLCMFLVWNSSQGMISNLYEPFSKIIGQKSFARIAGICPALFKQEGVSYAKIFFATSIGLAGLWLLKEKIIIDERNAYVANINNMRISPMTQEDLEYWQKEYLTIPYNDPLIRLLIPFEELSWKGIPDVPLSCLHNIMNGSAQYIIVPRSLLEKILCSPVHIYVKKQTILNNLKDLNRKFKKNSFTFNGADHNFIKNFAYLETKGLVRRTSNCAGDAASVYTKGPNFPLTLLPPE